MRRTRCDGPDSYGSLSLKGLVCGRLEASPGFEPGIEVLQSGTTPLPYSLVINDLVKSGVI